MKINKFIIILVVFYIPKSFAKDLIFSDYPIELYKNKRHPIQITKRNKLYQKVLTALSKEKINFSGSYIFDTIGCGGGCSLGLIYNTKTGYASYFKDYYSECYSVSYGFKPQSFEFKNNSQLLKVVGRRNGKVDNCELVYYLIENDNLKEISKKLVWK